MIDDGVLIGMWDTLKEYIPVKDRQSAADHIVKDLMDLDVEFDANELNLDEYFVTALNYYIEENTDDEFD